MKSVLQPLRMALNQSRNLIRFMSTGKAYKNILVERKGVDNRVGIVTLNRPEALNAVTLDLAKEVGEALTEFDSNPDIVAMILTGSEKSFSAGVDISSLLDGDKGPGGFLDDYIVESRNIEKLKKPLIAAVNGYCLGGACELMLWCDIVYAGDKVKIGQLEIQHGVMPGDGGTQRLPRYIGKSRAMEMCLTGERINAEEALRLGLVSKVFPAADLVEEAIKLGDKIGELSPKAVEMCKASVNNAYETHLKDGLKDENAFFKRIFSD